MTMRYANGEKMSVSRGNPDILVEHADVSVNGGERQARQLRQHPLHRNQFASYTVPVTLTKGANTVKSAASQRYNWDGTRGTTIGVAYSGGGADIGDAMRSSSAPHLDEVSFASQNPRHDLTCLLRQIVTEA